MTTTRIISFDGASAAALQIRLLRYFEQQCPGTVRKTEIFAGTSDGALMALYLAENVTNNDDQNLQVLDQAIAFSDELVPLFHLRCWNALKFATGWFPLLDDDKFRRTFQARYGDFKLDALGRKVIAVAFDVKRWTPQLFTNLLVGGSTDVAPLFAADPAITSVVDAALATSAMPLALALQRVDGLQPSVDGGVVANNPTLAAIVRACESKAGSTDANLVRPHLADLRVLSLGATESIEARNRIFFGIVPPQITYQYLWWGWIQWLVLRPLLLPEMLFQGSMELVDYQCSRLLSPDQYRRVRPSMTEVKTTLQLLFAAPTKTIDSLNTQAAALTSNPAFVAPNVSWLNNNWL